jgi:hypothetical protein
LFLAIFYCDGIFGCYSHLVGTTASVLSTLAGASGGTADATLRTQGQETLGPGRSKKHARGEATTYLRVENPLFLFLGGSADVVAAAGAAAATPPAFSTARAGASVAHVASLVGCLAPSPPPPPRPWVRGAKAPTSRGEPGPHRFPPPPLPRLTTSTPWSQARRAPAARAAGTPRSFAPDAPVAGCSASSCGPPAPAPATALCARPGLGRGRVGPRCIHGPYLQNKGSGRGLTPTSRGPAEQGKAELRSPVGRRGA